MRLCVVLGTSLEWLAGLLSHFIIKILWELRSLGREWVLVRNSCWVTDLGSQPRWYGVRSYNFDYFFLLYLFFYSLFLLPYLTPEALFCIFCIRYNLITYQSIFLPRMLLENLPYFLLVRYCCIIFLMVIKKVLEKTGAYFYSRQLNQEPFS